MKISDRLESQSHLCWGCEGGKKEKKRAQSWLGVWRMTD